MGIHCLRRLWVLLFVLSVFQLSFASVKFVSVLPGIVLSVGDLVFIWAGPSLSARRQFRNTPSAHDPMTIEASHSGLQIHSVHADSQVAWSTYVAWGENKSVFVVLPQPRISLPIPKRAFTAEQLVEFRELLGRNIKARRK